MARHPGVTAGVGGAGIIYNQAKSKASALEKEIMRNRVGAPGAKFANAELQKFAAHKRELSDRVLFLEKEAEGGLNMLGTGAEALARGVGGAFGEAGAKGITGLVQEGARKIQDKLVLEPKRQKALKELTTSDPIVSAYEANEPGATERAFSSMRNVAPKLSTDPNVVKSYLREAAQTGGTANYLTLKQLAEAEAAINRAVSGNTGGKP